MKRLLIAITILCLLSLLVACQQTPSDTTSDLAQTSSEIAEASIEYIVFESMDEFLTQVEAAEEELQTKGLLSNTLSHEAKTIKTNGLTEKIIYVPKNLIAKYGLVSIEMSDHTVDFIFPQTQKGNETTFKCMLNLDPVAYPIEGWFPIGRPIDSWTFQSAETTYFVQVDMMITTPTAKILSVLFTHDGQIFVAILPYGTSNEDIATLLTLEPASTIDDKKTKQGRDRIMM